jgi:hypothetical protein
MPHKSAAKKTLEPSLYFGGIEQGWHIAPLHFCVIGETGSGKTLTLRMLMKKVLERVGKGVRVVVYDPKGQLIPIIAGLLGGAPLDIAHIGDARSVGWDMARDCRTQKACRSIAHVLFPKDPNNRDVFFASASRTLITSLLRDFTARKLDWDFRDVLQGARDMHVLKGILSRTLEGRRIVNLYFGARTTLMNIMSTLANDTEPYLEVAAAWHAASRRISIREWVKGDEDRILVLGHDDENEPTSRTVNQALFQRLKQSLLTPPFVEGRETWVILDELALGGFPAKALLRLADLGRELGVRLVLSCLGIDGAIEEYGEKLAYQLFGSCINQAMLRTSSARTAEYFSKQLGKFETIEVQKSTTHGPSGQSRSESEHKVVRDAILASEFQTLPVASKRYGFDGVYLGELGAWRAHISPKEIKTRIGAPNASVPAFVPHDEEPVLRPWDEDDCKRLNLPVELLSEDKAPEHPAETGDEETAESPTAPPANANEPTVWTKLAALVRQRGKSGAETPSGKPKDPNSKGKHK